MMRRPPFRPARLALCIVAAYAWPFSAGAQTLLPGTVAGTRTVPGTSTWTGATPAGVSTGADGIRELLIRQTQSRAELNWQRFDVNVGERVRFDQQGNRNWVALNWIHSADPSQIAGRLVADGALYLINANGIVFRPGAQVDAAAFIASTLSIQGDAFVKGLTAMAAGQAAFRFDASAGSATARVEVQSGVVRRLDGTPVIGPDGQPLVQAATLQSSSGGRVFLFGTREVVNNGIVRSPDGQVILAAGSKVYLFAPTSSDSASFRGLFVEVDAGSEARALGSVTNTGTIETSSGNTTLTGLSILQAGRISADTAATGNGSVYLYARSNPVFQLGTNDRPKTTSRSGDVVLAPGSSIEARPKTRNDADGKPETLQDSQTVFASEVRMAGRTVHLQGNGTSGASVVAPGGAVSITADEDFSSTPVLGSPVTGPRGRIVVDAGSVIDVSGLRDVAVPVARNVLDVQLAGENVADNPTLRTGPLAQQRVQVDLRNGSPLLPQATLDAIAGQQIRRTIEERMTVGGTVSLMSTGEAVVNPGATIGIAGGSVAYQPGLINTTRLSDGRRTVDISQATPDRNWLYANAYTETDARWGVTRTYSLSRATWDPGYVTGANAGRLELVAPSVGLGGLVDGTIVASAVQRNAPPLGGAVTFGDRSAFLLTQPNFVVQTPLSLVSRPAAPATPFGIDDDAAQRFGTDVSPVEQVVDVGALTARGVSRIEAFANAPVRIPAGQPLTLSPGGRLTVSGTTVSVGADVSVPAARAEVVTNRNGTDVRSSGIDLSAVRAGAETASTPLNPLTVSGARIDASGSWLVDPPGATTVPTTPSLLNGGSVRLAGYRTLTVDANSVIDVSAGARRASGGSNVLGQSGSVQATLGYFQLPDPATPTRMTLAGSMAAHGFSGGGSFKATATDVLVSTSQPDGYTGLWVNPDTLVAQGFSTIDLTGYTSATLAAGTRIDLRPPVRQFGPAAGLPTNGAELQARTALSVAPGYLQAATSFALRSTSLDQGSVRIGSGSAVEVGPGGSIVVEAALDARVAGTLRAPGGSVSIAMDNGSGYQGFRGTQGVVVQSGARLDVNGADTTADGPDGRRVGTVTAGGTVTVDAPSGFLVVEPGATVAARGAQGRVAVQSNDTAAASPFQTLATPGGTVLLRSGMGGAIAGAIELSGGTPSVASGALTIAQTRELPVPTPTPGLGPRPIRVESIRILPDGEALPAGFTAGADFDRAVNAGVAPGAETFQTRVARSTLSGSDAGRVTLSGRDLLLVDSDTRIAAGRQVSLDLPAIRVQNGARLEVAAPYVELGWTKRPPALASTLPLGVQAGPGSGDGSVSIQGSLAVDLVGQMTLQGTGRTTIASDADLRLRGIYNPVSGQPLPEYATGGLAAAGRVDLIARQLFPVTGSDYLVSVSGAGSTIGVQGPAGDSSAPATPLSALGRVTMTAANIDIGGRVRAPFGDIAINASDTLTLRPGAEVSVASAGTIVPYGLTQDRRQIVYPFQGGNIGVSLVAVDRSISLTGRTLDLQPGARLDATGGGDLLASQFVAGSGGSVDVLLRPNVFAIVPGYSAAMPSDYQIASETPTLGATAAAAATPFRGALPSTTTTRAAPSLSVGDQLTLSAGSGLPAGTYTLLPARYAQLPGAYLVATTESRSFQPVPAARLADGSVLLSALRGAQSTAQADARWTSVNVLDGTQWRRYAEYVNDLASHDLGAKGDPVPVRPQDGGTLSIAATSPRLSLGADIAVSPGTPLVLTGTAIEAAPAGTADGRRGALDIASSGASIRVGAPGAAAVGQDIVLDAMLLSRIDAGRLTLGATRATVAGVDRVVPTAATISVDPGTTLRADTVILAATRDVSVGAGATVASNDTTAAGRPLAIDAPGAVLMTSGAPSTMTRGTADTTVPTITLGAGAAMNARSARLDAAGGVRLDPSASLQVRELGVAGRDIALGDGPANGAAATSTTRLDSTRLAALSALDSLSLTSTGTLFLTEGLTLGSASLGRLSISSPSIRWGGGAATAGARMTAQSVVLAAPATTTSAAPVAGAGRVAIEAVAGSAQDAGTLVLGAGDRTVDGFATASLRAASGVVLDGTGSTRLTGSTTVATPVVVARTAATQSLQADRLDLIRNAAASPAPDAQFGGSLALTAGAVAVDTAIRLPSGMASVVATSADAGSPALALGPNATIDVGSARLDLFGRTFTGAAGEVRLESRAGSVETAPGSVISASATGDSKPGSITISAPTGTATLSGRVIASADTGRGGRFSVDAARIQDPGSLAAALADGKVDGGVTMRQRQGDLVLGTGAQAAATVIGAESIVLSADAGSVRLAGGRLDASGANGGSVQMLASDAVSIAPGATVSAAGTAGAGGRVVLAGARGVTATGATVDVSGTTTGGEAEFRLTQDAAIGGGLSVDAGTVRGASTVYVTGVQAYVAPSNRIDTAALSSVTTSGRTVFEDAADFVDAYAPVAIPRFGAATAPRVRVRPEIEFDSAPGASLTLATTLDLSSIRFTAASVPGLSGGMTPTAGVLTLRAARDLLVNGTSNTPGTTRVAVLNDGFVDPSDAANFDLTATSTWSYRLVAGADLSAADPRSVRSLSDPGLVDASTRPTDPFVYGSLRVLGNLIIRTGTGSIDLAAARSVLLGTASGTAQYTATDFPNYTYRTGTVSSPAVNILATSRPVSIYTAGRPVAPLAGFVDPQDLYNDLSLDVDPRARFVSDGGSISVRAGDSVAAQVAPDTLASAYLYRQGVIDPVTRQPVEQRSPAWWPRFDQFTQTVGALGGGDVTLSAGRNVDNVSAAATTSGRSVVDAQGGITVDVQGRGDVRADAGGSIRSGAFVAMNGSVSLSARESVGAFPASGTATTFAPIVGLGDASLSVSARRDAAVDQVYNPTLVAQTAVNASIVSAEGRSFFSTYGDRSTLSVTSIGGQVSLRDAGRGVLRLSSPLRDSLDPTDAALLAGVRPPNLSLTALSGDVEIVGRPISASQSLPTPATIPLASAYRSDLTIAAARSVQGVGSVVQLDTDPATSFVTALPGTTAGEFIVSGLGTPARIEFSPGRLFPESTTPLQAHAQSIVRQNDTSPAVVLAGQDITTSPVSLASTDSASQASRLRIAFAEPASVRAGRDIVDVNLNVQNLRDSDVSGIRAGRDIVNRAQLNVISQLVNTYSGIVVNGPGRVEITAGRNVAMGTSIGIITRGNLDNIALPESGASVTLIAGLPDSPAYDAFLQRYVAPGATATRADDYATLLTDFVRASVPPAESGSIDASNAWQRFATLPETERNAFARTVFFTELRVAGRIASSSTVNGQPNPSYGKFQDAYDAMAVLFPKDGAGNIDLVFSQVKTERGGKVELIAPGVVCRGDWTACSPTDASKAVGNLFVGMTNPPSNLSAIRPASRLGIFTLGDGDIEVALGSDGAVNRSRVLTAGGGGITMFSAQGNLDAGRGSRTATSSPPPLVRVDANGNVVVELPGVVEGSGIGVLVTKPGTKAGDVDLFAPKGFIDAGEAGIRSAGNLTLFATEVRNAANISFSGSSVGVPVSTPAPNLSLAATGNTTAAATAEQNSAERDAREEQRRQARPRLLLLEFLGFGDEGEEAYRRRTTR